MQETLDRAWIETYSGKKFHILNPSPDEIFIEDIAHALSLQCRFNGHTRNFYSVAQHSVYVSKIVPPEDALWGLLHDASEAYIMDMTRPMKRFTEAGAAYMKVEAGVMAAICQRFKLNPEQPESVHKADNRMLFTEKNQLMAALKWDTNWAENEKAADIVITSWSPTFAENLFLSRFEELQPLR